MSEVIISLLHVRSFKTSRNNQIRFFLILYFDVRSNYFIPDQKWKSFASDRKFGTPGFG